MYKYEVIVWWSEKDQAYVCIIFPLGGYSRPFFCHSHGNGNPSLSNFPPFSLLKYQWLPAILTGKLLYLIFANLIPPV